jgi:transposase, IS5 family
MARRRIGQEHLRLGDGEGRRASSLDPLGGLIAWAEIDRHLAPIDASIKGEPAWPPLSLFKARLLAVCKHPVRTAAERPWGGDRWFRPRG